MMSPQSDLPSMPQVLSQRLVQEVLTRFDAYARIRGGRDSILAASRTTGQQENSAFNDLAEAVDRLRNALG
ncbi:hypothetical protein SALBM311S_00845 [Streptomyces alboniger]